MRQLSYGVIELNEGIDLNDVDSLWCYCEAS